MEFAPLPGEKRVIYGEGAVHQPFIGSVYMRGDGETDKRAAWRFEEAMKSIGFEWLGAGK